MGHQPPIRAAGPAGLAASLAALILSTTGHAAEQPPVRWKTPLQPVTYPELALEGASLTKLVTQDEAAVQPEYRIGIHFRRNGDIVETQRRTIQFLKAGALDAYGNIELNFDASTTSATISRAQVLRKDGSVTSVDRSTLQTLNNTAGGVFSDDVTVIVPWAGLQIGAVGVLEAELLTRGTGLVMPWGRVIYPTGIVPRGYFSLVVTWDEQSTEPVVVAGDGAPPCIPAGTRRVECRAGALPAVASDPNVNYLDDLPGILVAERRSWSQLSDRMRGIVDRAAVVDDPISRKAAELTQDAVEPMAKVQRLHSFVSREVRYLGLEHGEKGFIPERAATTLQRRYGDCKDKSALFIALAKSAGLEVFPVLSSTTRKNPDRLLGPSIAYFDHMIACVNIEPGQTRCIDLTDDSTATDEVPAQLNGAVALRLAPGEVGPTVLPSSKFGWRLTEETTNTVDESGNGLERQHRSYGGELAGYIRLRFRDLDTKERTERAVRDYQQWIGDKAQPVFTFGGLPEQQAAPTLTSITKFPGLISGGPLEDYSERLVWLEELAGWASSENDHFPYRFVGISYSGTQVYDLNPTWRIGWLGPSLSLDSRFGTMARTYKREGQRVTVTTSVRYPARLIPVADMPAFRKALRNLQTQSKVQFGISAGR